MPDQPVILGYDRNAWSVSGLGMALNPSVGVLQSPQDTGASIALGKGRIVGVLMVRTPIK